MKPILPDNLLIVGRIGRPYGVKGWQHLQSFTDPIDNIFQYQPWWLYHQRQWQPFQLLDKRLHHDKYVIKLEGIDSPEIAKQFSNTDIAADKCLLAELSADEYYWDDLIGCQVITTDEQVLGKITEILRTGAQDVLVIEGDKRHLIPFVQGEFIQQVNLAEHRITVSWDPSWS